MSELSAFVRDSQSPAMGMYTHLLKLIPVDRERRNGPKELVKYWRATERGLDLAIEPGTVGELPGVRALLLWDAQSSGYNRLTLDEAIRKQEGSDPALFLTSVQASGRLAVSSYLGYDTTTYGVMMSGTNRSHAYDSRVEVDMVDYGPIAGFTDLVRRHVARAQHDQYDVMSPLSNAVDLELAKLLATVPESPYQIIDLNSR